MVAKKICPHCGSRNTDKQLVGYMLNQYCSDCDQFISNIETFPEGKVESSADIPMPFGKHAGKKLSEIPEDYLVWISRELDLKANLEKAIIMELNRRNSK